MMRAVMIVMGVVAATLVLGAVGIDEGEVVTLLTTDSDSHVQDTQLWTVELDGVHYLRASNSRVAWLLRLRERPVVELEVADQLTRYRAVPLDDSALRSRVNAEMAEKYGFADRLWGALGDRSVSIPIRLDPVPAEDSMSPRGEAS